MPHLTYRLKAEPSEIFMLSWGFDATDGVAILSTDDPSVGLVSLLMPEEQLAAAEAIIGGMIADGMKIQKLEIVKENEKR